MDRPLAIDLFSGVGGLSLGFEQAGFDVVAAVEYDTVHAAAHAYNFPNCAVLARSVVGLSGKEIRRRAGIQNSPIEVVFGGAPCQGFSLIGQRVLDDPRNNLVREFVRIVQELGANHFVFENVKGLTLGAHRKFLDELISTFKEIGYQVRAPWRVLNASSYGTPQNRERLILLGSRNGLALPEYPEPTTSNKAGQTTLARPPTCADALSDLPDVESFDELLSSDEIETPPPSNLSSYAKLMRCKTRAGWYYGYRRQWNSALLTSSARTNHTSISQRRFLLTKPGKVEPISRFFKLPPDGLANTLRAGSDSARGAFTSPRPIHYLYPRCITVREMARLHGFPDWFRFHATKWHGARQIGNAVPPPLARAIASKILESANITPRFPQGRIAMGKTPLLHMGMAEASRYWGVPVPIGKRDRKSGIRKRKQEEIEAAQQKELTYA